MASSRRRFLLSAAALGGAAAGRRTAPEIGAAASAQATGSQATPSPTPQDVSDNAFAYRRNWGRWGTDDQMGAVNLITPRSAPQRRRWSRRDARCRSAGRSSPSSISSGSTSAGPARSVVDYYGFMYHGVTVTHVDALVPHLGSARHVERPRSGEGDRHERRAVRATSPRSATA